jgi:WD40 repeat protein
MVAVVDGEFSPNGELVATASRDGTTRLWRAAGGSQIALLPAGDWVTQARFSPKGNYLATTTTSGGISVWAVNNFAKLFSVKGHGYWIFNATFSSDEKYLLTIAGGVRPTGFPARADRSARLWNVQSGERLAVFELPDKLITDAAFSPDGQSIVTCGTGTIAVWDLKSRQILRTIETNQGWINHCAFALEQTRFLTVSDKGTSIWDFDRGQLLEFIPPPPWAYEMPPHPRANVASIDGVHQRVVVGYDDGTAAVWRVFRTAQELIDFSRNAVPRQLTGEQRSRFFLQ